MRFSSAQLTLQKYRWVIFHLLKSKQVYDRVKLAWLLYDWGECGGRTYATGLLLGVQNIDSGKITILTALDMSAAFDTLDHATLLHRLKHTFGLSGFVISWIQSYLFSRSSFVKIDSSSSPITTILTGVPQGSVLGPLLFVLFISPIANVINPGQACNNLVSFHQYADDTQLYIGANSSSLPSQIASIESCTLRVHDWLLNNGLHLNPSKSEAIAFFNPRSKPLRTLAESVESISVAGSPIKLQTSIKNLGVYLDSRLSFDKQVSETCKASYFHIRALRHIRSSLTAEAAKTVATAIVGSRLDYCNSLLAGTSVSNLSRLQLVQNTLARIVAQKSRFDHIMPVLSELHWLPVRWSPNIYLYSVNIFYFKGSPFLLSNTIFSCLLILTVGHLVASRHPNVSRFVIRHHLLPSC